MPDRLHFVFQQFESLVQRFRFGEQTVFRALDFSSDELMDTSHILQSLSVGWTKDDSGQDMLSIHVQDERFMNCTLVDWLRKAADGRVQVYYTGRASANSVVPPLIGPSRPLEMGFSVSHEALSGSGSIGFFAMENGQSVVGLVSCNHVIADQASSSTHHQVRQPSGADGGRSEEEIASPFKWITLGPIGNRSDAAYARLSQKVRFSTQTPAGIPPLSGQTVPPSTGMPVHKVGRTTGVTHGKIESTGRNNLALFYPRFGTLTFDDVVSISSTEDGTFCHGGDSGSLVVDDNGHAVGLLFGSVDGLISDPFRMCYMCKINPILELLDLTIMSSP